MAILKKEINDLLNKQVIEKTLSPFVSPCFLVKKKPNEGSSEENYRGKCHKCFSCKPRPIIQPIGNFPPERISSAAAFTTT
ncbi:hypothetical protein, partial [Klebsiella pneumoniae]|uniref:hypothetical protein n=1 Tax=Klebsiella pneumoniae TaxID=573 RepID=UPI00405578E8